MFYVHSFLPPTLLASRKEGRTLRKGVFLPSKRLLSPFYDTPPLLRTLLRTSVSIEALTRRLLRTLLRSTSLKLPSKNPSKKRVVA